MTPPLTAIPFSVPSEVDVPISGFPHAYSISGGGYSHWATMEKEYQQELLAEEEALTPFDSGSIPGSTSWRDKHLEGLDCQHCTGDLTVEWVDFYGGYQTYCINCGLTGPADENAKICVNKYKELFQL